MAFDRPLEADSVDDVGFLGSLIRAPVVGIIWLLGGERADGSEEEANEKRAEDLRDRDDVGGGGEEGGCRPEGDSDGSHCREREESAVAVDPPPDDVLSPSPATSAPPGQSDDQAEAKGNNKENEVPSSLQNWPSVDFSNPPKNYGCDDDVKSSPASAGGIKKMSWSDECGNGSLVEYFDDSAVAPSRSRHWSAMRRNNWRASHPGFDGGSKSSSGSARQNGAIKGVLKRSGSYSPPAPSLYACNSRGNASSNSTDLSPAPSSSSSEGRSFPSITAIGSSDTPRFGSSDHASKESMNSQDDSIAAVTYKKLNVSSTQCVPSMLQVGCGRAGGGLIIPRGGPGDARYRFPIGGHNNPTDRITFGAGAPSAHEETKAANDRGEQEEEKDESSNQEFEAPEKAAGSPNPDAYFAGGRSNPGHRHHYLPRHHTNGYISPQYGFYVNITPPAPESHTMRKPLQPGETLPGSTVPSYRRFQCRSDAPAPIPEGKLGTPGIPPRLGGRSSAPRPSSNEQSSEMHRASGARKNSMKPAFTENKKGMGVLLAGNPHCGVWPTVPFG